MGVLSLSHLEIERAEPKVAVGLKRAHAQLLSQAKSLTVVDCSGLDLWGGVVGLDLAAEPQGVGFVAPFLVGPRELQRTLRLDVCLGQPAGAQIRLAQPDHPEGMVNHKMHRQGLFDCLLQQWQGVSDPSGECIGCSQGRSSLGEEEPKGHLPHEGESPFESGEGLVEVALAQRPKAHGVIRQDTAVGVIGSLGNLYPFLGGRSPLGEGATLGKAVDEAVAGAHGGQSVQAEEFLE